MSVQKMEANGCVNMRFIVFLKATLGKMVATNTLGRDFINLQFWQTWPRKFYNIKSYDSTKDDFEIDNAKLDDTGFSSKDEDEIVEDALHTETDQNDQERETPSNVNTI